MTQGSDDVRSFLSRRWPALQETLSVDLGPPGETVKPRLSLSSARREQLLSSFRAPDEARPQAGRVEVHEVLGMGGMGVVHHGTQASLDRSVAIKAVRPDKMSDEATVKLLQEAWVAGTLEHPNIIPIYDIGTGADGAPLIVQQRVGGTVWSELIDDEALVRERFGADLLEWNLRVLMQVCNAVHFAHDRGVLHLDIKPSNVMIGDYGEVLLLDWGLAMSLREVEGGRLPLVRENVDVIGTPAFMAPEMLAQGDVPLDERTDVYLLGATLYRICAGHPPHQGTSALATMFAVATKEPAPLDQVPGELAAICHTALSPDAADRQPGADALRKALQEFLAHRDAVRVADQAAERVRELQALWADEGATDPEHLRGLFSAARFGLEQAASLWEEAPSVRSSLRELHLGMARWELRSRRPQAASALLAAVDSPPPDLVADVEAELAALRALGDRVERLQEYRDQQDIRVGMRTRTLIVGFLGVGFTLLPLRRALFPERRGADELMSLSVPFVLLLVATVLIVWARDSMTRSAINRRTTATAYILLLGETLLTLITQRLELPFNEALPLMMTFWAAVGALFAVHVDRRLLPTSLGYVVAVAAALTWPAHQWWFATAAAAAFTVNVFVVWWPRPGPRGGEAPRPLADAIAGDDGVA